MGYDNYMDCCAWGLQWLVVIRARTVEARSLRFPLQMVLNLAELITSPAFGSGFVPNGGRAYYTKRSQPPLLSEMVWAVYAVYAVCGGMRNAAV